MIKHGPVDVVLLTAKEPKFDGRVLFELEKQVAAGTIRVLDGMIVVKDPSGMRKTVDIEDLPPAESAKLGFVPSGMESLFSSYDTEGLYKEMEPGTAVMALAIEQTWAVGLLNSIVDAGAELVLHFAVPAAVVNAAFASLEQTEELAPEPTPAESEKPAEPAN